MPRLWDSSLPQTPACAAVATGSGQSGSWNRSKGRLCRVWREFGGHWNRQPLPPHGRHDPATGGLQSVHGQTAVSKLVFTLVVKRHLRLKRERQERRIWIESLTHSLAHSKLHLIMHDLDLGRKTGNYYNYLLQEFCITAVMLAWTAWPWKKWEHACYKISKGWILKVKVV